MLTQVQEVFKNDARGRKDSDGQESVITIKQMTPKEITDLVELRAHLDAVRADLNDAIKAKAEQYGVHAQSLRKFIDAKASENFEDKKTKVLQMALVFETLN